MKTTAVAQPAAAPPEPGPPANYLDLYGLSKSPFSATGDGSNYILFGSHRRAFELLVDHLVNGSGMIVLQGEEGIGKTETLHAAAIAARESGLSTIIVSRPRDHRLNLGQLAAALRGRTGEKEQGDVAITHILTPPRKVVLIDDVDLLPSGCVHLLLSLVRRIPNETGAPAIILGTSVNLAVDPARPDFAQIAATAKNTVRLPRLGSAEVRQYIERSLWISGGTTRRLITPDAIKLLIARSGGLPGSVNRLMEAVLTAGFARGDTIVTAKTVAAATGPIGSPRPRAHFDDPMPSGRAGYAMQIGAIVLLAAGLSLFLYKGLTGLAQPQPHADVQSAPAPATLPAPQQPEVIPAPAPLPPELMAAMLKRGDQSLALGDIAAARLLYQRAAEAGNAQAATALGKTYDPKYVAAGQRPNPARAAAYYRKAITLGDRQATALLADLNIR